jgi:protein-tyrosine-phosphatase
MEGMPASPHTLEVLREQGIDFSLFRSQLVTNALVEQATHVFAMTHGHLRGLSTLYPAYQKKFFLLNEGTTQDDITDPIGGSLAAYQECGQRIQQALENILMLINKNAL